jgi:hypothetical protein
MTDLDVEFVGGPLDGVVSIVRAMTSGQPPGRFTIDVITPGGGGHANHDYQVGTEPNARGRWPYEYAGICGSHRQDRAPG